jgi:hypothetical protein
MYPDHILIYTLNVGTLDASLFLDFRSSSGFVPIPIPVLTIIGGWYHGGVDEYDKIKWRKTNPIDNASNRPDYSIQPPSGATRVVETLRARGRACCLWRP